jgi:protein gp37
MGKVTQIGWTHHTFNIVWGCTIWSEECRNCYAKEWAERLGFDVWGQNASRRVFGEEHWREPLAWNKAAEKAGQRRRVFCSSMADVFEDHPMVHEERKKLWPLIAATPWLDWLLLTKRPENADWMTPRNGWATAECPWWTWPRNAWLGFTGGTQETFDERWQTVENVGRARHIPVLFCSMEPMLERINIEAALDQFCDDVELRTLDWLIIGGESGKKARPFELNWIGDILKQLDGLSVPVYVKQLGAKPTLLGHPLTFEHPKGEDSSEWPCAYRRQEFPRS